MKRGFTLIELLAVIVILAIIALIAVPIVVNIINDSKTSSDEQSLELYLDTVEKTITKKQLSNPNFNPDKCKILSNGDLQCYKGQEDLGILKIEMKGAMPEKGTILMNNNKYIFKNIKYNNNKYYSVATLLNDIDDNNKVSIGDKYKYKVNDTDEFDFYVLSFNNNDTVNLIMNRNICEDGTTNYTETNSYCKSAWNVLGNHNKYGPITVMKYLYESTKKWIAVPDMIMNYRDDYEYRSGTGYTNIITNQKITTVEKKLDSVILGTAEEPLKARLPLYNEVYSQIDMDNLLPTWLVENLADTPSWCSDKCKLKYANTIKQSNIYSYWLLSPDPRNSINPQICYYSGDITSYSFDAGIRPVITVPIEDLEQ